MPLIVAANGNRTLALAARLGDSWVTTGVASDDLAGWWAGVGELSHRYDDALTAAGRDARLARRYLSLDASGVHALSSADCFADAVGRAGELGFTDVVTHWPRPDGP